MTCGATVTQGYTKHQWQNHKPKKKEKKRNESEYIIVNKYITVKTKKTKFKQQTTYEQRVGYHSVTRTVKTIMVGISIRNV